MRRQGKGSRLLAITLGLSLVAAACGGDDEEPDGGEEGTDTTEEGADAPDGPTGGTLVDLQNFSTGEPDHIDPQLSSVHQGSQVTVLLFDGLTEYDFTGDEPELMPQVAESWETEDGQTWVFTIKEDQVFSDGSPVLPSSFKRAIERLADPDMASEVAYHAEPIAGVSEKLEGQADEVSGVIADDEAMTLTFELNYPFYDWPAVVSHAVFSPVPESVEELEDQTQWEQDVMIGNGPFAMDGPWQHEQAINLVRNEEWSGGILGEGELARLDGIEFIISADIDSAYADFESGNGHTGYIPSGRFAEATENYPNATEGTMGVYFMGVNQESQLGGEENTLLRQAISLAIDREAINESVYDGARRVATGITPPEVAGYEDGLCGDICEYDPDRAEDLIAQWQDEGGELDHPIRINFNSGSGHEDVMAIVQQNLEDVGLEAEQDPRDPTNYFAEMRQGDCELCRLGWIWDYPVYDSPIFAELHSDSIDGDNIARYSNPEVDQAIDDARATEAEEDRLALYREAEQLALEDVALVPLNWYTGQVVYTEEVGNVFQDPLQWVHYETITLES